MYTFQRPLCLPGSWSSPLADTLSSQPSCPSLASPGKAQPPVGPHHFVWSPRGGPPCCHQVVLAAPSPLPPVYSDLLHLSPRPREKTEATSQVPWSTCHSSPSSGQLQAVTPTPSVETLSLLATQGPRSLCRGSFYIICMSL